MRPIFRIGGNESQPGLQLVEKLATPLVLAVFLGSSSKRVKCSAILSCSTTTTQPRHQAKVSRLPSISVSIDVFSKYRKSVQNLVHASRLRGICRGI